MYLHTVRDILKLTATAMAGIFSGSALYMNLADHPARMTLEREASRKHFKETFNRIRVSQSMEVLIGSLAALGVYFLEEEEKKTIWLVGAGTLFTILPFTKFVMMPNIIKLCKDNAIKTLGDFWVYYALNSWNNRHAVRTVLAISSFGIFLYALFKDLR